MVPGCAYHNPPLSLTRHCGSSLRFHIPHDHKFPNYRNSLLWWCGVTHTIFGATSTSGMGFYPPFRRRICHIRGVYSRPDIDLSLHRFWLLQHLRSRIRSKLGLLSVGHRLRKCLGCGSTYIPHRTYLSQPGVKIYGLANEGSLSLRLSSFLALSSPGMFGLKQLCPPPLDRSTNPRWS